MALPLLTVTLNATVDKTYLVSGFEQDRVNRPQETRTTAGGKGINVARVYQALGGPVRATGFVGGSNGNFLERQLAAERIDTDFVRVSGESRVCVAIIDLVADTLTEVNEVGPDVTSADCTALLEKLRELLPGCAAVIISGSMPPGVPFSLYRDIVLLAQNDFGVPAALDVSGAALKLGIEAKPFLVKPNLSELAALPISADDAGKAAQAIREKYAIPFAIVTAGEHGAVAASADGIWEAMPPKVCVRSAVGSGDSLAAGLLWAMLQGQSLPDALKIAVGAGTANALTYSAGFCERSQILALAEQVEVRQRD